MPVPTDPRTPQQRIEDQLIAARRKLAGPSLPRSERARLADRIHALTEQAKRLGA
ncbi:MULTISPECIES: hypothetical protein [Streptomyces]|uniref:Uncharacterized protein n=2 Tax=Streptomyces rimosus TaxID=1927 RepID=A0A8F7KU32_STRRM|nr:MULTISPECIES: hypothetical protein [Streptomyces]QXV92089.1 hypothetical protein M4018_082870 [Streptomyces rimosus]QXV92358.1 hypothetical protein R6500_082870 [Streptomyces rimosus]UNZ08694.1 hypothetical protein SRIMR7_41745 [Streptomyces rimosus subsp. rimosus]UTI00369.1 hypothetical protein SRIMHP_40190 [Streptomyces rimosus subsp. rimosus]UTJ18466.1 hypothetical protein SRIMDV3_40085 [Streptomyces rimosus subsp. rimosus]